ncbi:MAG: U32 family peptidase [Candidatus Aenigmarchaeota archaeon]|nr:U32 family peptidase [Candidatus Aenigmarchaeota archaeon]
MKQEIVSPAGDWTMLRAAVKAGADAVYFGTDSLNMRMNAENFTLADIPKVIEFCHDNSVKTHLALNSIMFNNEMKKIENILEICKKSDLDMVICWDMSVVRKALEYNIPICLSTQASVSNVESAKFFKELGIQRIVPARECSLEDIKKIKKTGVEVEIFIHGAMCVSISGRCFMSHHLYGKSANRGECMQPCRYEYNLIDKQQGKEFVIDGNRIMSPKDLCTIMFFDKLIDTGADAFKIEGRKRSPEYVLTTTTCYRKALDLYRKKQLTSGKKKELLKELNTVFNRGFSNGFYLGKPSDNDFSQTGASSATTRKMLIGKVVNISGKIAVLKIESQEIRKGDLISIQGPQTGVVMHTIDKMKINDKQVELAKKADYITIELEENVNKNDSVFAIKNV